ncbi:Deacetylase sirtuin-type domain-containing protein [Vibrio crassostreae]|uniref:SIR2 family NAD-dependent protein deacylase n=1 Tax=unclassified Vibrio TaxID=2614977 RepID=UPI002A73E9B1|nr:Deacetylase sirtuin-type domain-containing protein [Vibrio crassostreae]CAK2575072.1 Deacetylase sirtuin-type domain-containing protein [Vibrio crassostreae]CAK2978279.1 Deacetylase sirtuin-type domain-containing protein [Vibrio crassostreae]
MKVIILSGAGLSVPSELPAYEDIKNTPEYQAFQGASPCEVLALVKKIRHKYEQFLPNRAHYECMYLETYCQSLGVEFLHYTLNIDDLIEKAGGSAVHLHGCINEPDSIVKCKDVPCVDLFNIEWEVNDLLIVLGVSNNGFPLAALEANALASGAKFVNYNIVSNSETSNPTVIGDVSEVFKFLDHRNLPPIELTEVDLGFIVYQIECNIMESEYTVYLTPSTEGDFSDGRLEDTEDRIGMKLNENCFEIKFDLKSNIENQTLFEQPERAITRQQLNLLGRVIAALILSHSRSKNVIVYTASAVDERLVLFYNLLARKYADQLEYDSWCSFGTEGINYAFKKK